MKNDTVAKLGLLASLLLFATEPAQGNSVLIDTARGPDTADVVMNLNGAIMIGDGSALPGAEVGVAMRISDRAPLYLGGEFGVFIATGTPSYALFPLMGDLYYQFEPNSGVHPLLGIMMGPVIATGGGVSTARLGAFFRPGFNFELGQKAVLNVEPRLGVVGSSFVFLPLIGAIFPI